MNRLAVSALVGPLLFSVLVSPAASASTSHGGKAGACRPSPMVLKALAVPVKGLTSQQVDTATAIINAAAKPHVPERGQTIAVMAALEASSLGSPTGGAAHGTSAGLFGQSADQGSKASQTDPTSAAQDFYRSAEAGEGLAEPPADAGGARGTAQPRSRRLRPLVARRRQRVVNALTTGSGIAGLRNLAARAQAIADCEAATVRGRFSVNAGTGYVGEVPAAELDRRALELAAHGGSDWFDRCQNFVAVLDGRPHSGYNTALDAWQTFESKGVAHLVTSADGVAPPVGAWLYYRDGTNPAGHVVTYLGNGQIASTDVFAHGRVGVGPAKAITDGPWHMQYLGWAAPWGRE